MPAHRWRQPVERVSANDATTLATDRGPAPMNIGAVLVVERGGDLSVDDVRALLSTRLPGVRRLRQRLMPTPPGCGRPVWVDADDFRIDRHVEEVALTAGGEVRDGLGVLDVAAALVCTRLPRDRPLWSARWVTGLPGGDAALVIVLHHCLADGLGGLAALAALCDGDRPATGAATVDGVLSAAFPVPSPPWRVLAGDAWRARASGLRRLPRRLAVAGRGVRELSGGSRPRLAARTSLNRPTGDRRRLAASVTPLEGLVATAHGRGCTVNDLVLTAVAGALDELLHRRGEHPAELVASVPISTRRSTTAERLGNQTGVLPLAVPLVGDPDERLKRIAALTAGRRAPLHGVEDGPEHGPVRGSSAAPLGLAFRALAAVGVFQFFIDRQRLVHTFVTNLRGPAVPFVFAGHRVVSITPMAVTPGNVGVSFDVLSYAARLVVTVVADPALVPDPDDLAARVGDALRRLATGPAPGPGVPQP